MKRRNPGLEPELQAFLNPPRIERRAPPEVRARALARARAVVAAGGAVPTSAPLPLDPPAPVAPPVPIPMARGRVLVRVALGAIAVAVGALGALAALHSRTTHRLPVSLPESRQLAPSSRDERFAAPSGASPTLATPPAATAKPARPARAGRQADPFTAELELLQRAHAAYTRGDFPSALMLVAQHARRFPEGRLAEQREALRVRSLVGAGRSDEAHRAAADFALRFPRSVLLPRVEGAPEAGE